MRKQLTLIIINTVFLIAFLVCQGVSAAIIAPMQAGRAATAWSGQSGERFAQLEVFFPYSYSFDEESIYQLHSSLDTALTAASIDASDNRRLYTDAWSSEGTITVIGQRGQATVPAIGTGGDFFLFHPLYLRSGSYISPNDIMRDKVILDEELAWRLYGSVNLAGLEVTINNKPFIISGVVTRESGFAYSRAYKSGAGMFMSHEALSAVLQETAGSPARINSYEIVMPDLVTDFARSTLETALMSDSLQIVDNTSRFDYSNLFNLIVQFGTRSMREDTLAYPYWENAARFAEDWLSLLFLLSLICLICPIVFAVMYSIKLFRFIGRKIKAGVLLLLKKREDRAYRKYMERLEREQKLKQEQETNPEVIVTETATEAV